MPKRIFFDICYFRHLKQYPIKLTDVLQFWNEPDGGVDALLHVGRRFVDLRRLPSSEAGKMSCVRILIYVARKMANDGTLGGCHLLKNTCVGCKEFRRCWRSSLLPERFLHRIVVIDCKSSIENKDLDILTVQEHIHCRDPSVYRSAAENSKNLGNMRGILET